MLLKEKYFIYSNPMQIHIWNVSFQGYGELHLGSDAEEEERFEREASVRGQQSSTAVPSFDLSRGKFKFNYLLGKAKTALIIHLLKLKKHL